MGAEKQEPPASPAGVAGATVFIVDDSREVRDVLEQLVRSAGLRAECFPCGEEFLAGWDPGRPGCLLLDLRLPGMSGLELLEELAARGCRLPVIVVTGHGDVGTAVLAMKAGAADFIEKPFTGKKLVERIRELLGRELAAAASLCAEGWHSTLSAREREVLDLVVAGKSTKEIAALLGRSPRTVEKHRARILKKAEVDSTLALLRRVLSAPIRKYGDA